MKKWLCDWCGQTKETRIGLPNGWFTLKEPGEILVCSTSCMAATFDELQSEHREVAEAWRTGR